MIFPMSVSNHSSPKLLQVYYCPDQDTAAAENSAAKLKAFPCHALNNESWPGIPTLCTADFMIAHTGESILLKFIVSNDYFSSLVRPINTEVHMDNCVEFFISFDASAGAYYNIEFNCLGIGKLGYGLRKTGRTLLDESLINRIRTITSMNRRGERFDWEMFLHIPKEVFAFHQIKSFAGMTATVNFYKCGDGLPNPHYLCWNKITAGQPDFHLPEYFGRIDFLEA